ncbi:MAG: hypothetical protein QOE11_1188 [Solirubrobacteraceae bacterium]|jgi:hypothetical protein|nr:hypothetical protein [Solirubrobacteraceae bacterium]
MADDEILRRLDEHLAVANAHMARGNELWARSQERWARSEERWARSEERWARSEERSAENRDALAELRQSIDDMRVELRQTSLRGQRVAERFEAEVRLSREQRVQERAEDRTVLRDMLAESRAGRGALFVILDEIRGRGGPAAAGA